MQAEWVLWTTHVEPCVKYDANSCAAVRHRSKSPFDLLLINLLSLFIRLTGALARHVLRCYDLHSIL